MRDEAIGLMASKMEGASSGMTQGDGKHGSWAYSEAASQGRAGVALGAMGWTVGPIQRLSRINWIF